MHNIIYSSSQNIECNTYHSYDIIEYWYWNLSSCGGWIPASTIRNHGGDGRVRVFDGHQWDSSSSMQLYMQ